MCLKGIENASGIFVAPAPRRSPGLELAKMGEGKKWGKEVRELRKDGGKIGGEEKRKRKKMPEKGEKRQYLSSNLSF